jgi:hypothetical protein
MCFFLWTNDSVYLLTYLLTELSPSWGAANCAAPQEPPSIIWNPKVQYRVHKSPPLVPVLVSPKCCESLKRAFISFVLGTKRKEECTGDRTVLFSSFQYLKSLYHVLCLVTYHMRRNSRIDYATQSCGLICLMWVSVWISPESVILLSQYITSINCSWRWFFQFLFWRLVSIAICVLFFWAGYASQCFSSYFLYQQNF